MELTNIIGALATILIGMIAVGIVTGTIMKKKGYSSSWYVIGIFLFLIGLFIALLLPKVEKPQINTPKVNVNEAIKKEINNVIYKMHMFYLPHFFVAPFVIVFVFALLTSPFMLAVAEGWDYVFSEAKGLLLLVIIGIPAVVGVGAVILLGIFRSWKKEDHIEDVLSCAWEYGLMETHSPEEFLSDIYMDIKAGMDYQATYLGISNRYICGVVLSKSGASFRPVIIPQSMISKILCDFHMSTALIGFRLTHYYTGGYNVVLNNGKTIVLSYGSKPGLKKGLEELRKCGIPMEEMVK